MSAWQVPQAQLFADVQYAQHTVPNQDLCVCVYVHAALEASKPNGTSDFDASSVRSRQSNEGHAKVALDFIIVFHWLTTTMEAPASPLNTSEAGAQ